MVQAWPERLGSQPPDRRSRPAPDSGSHPFQDWDWCWAWPSGQLVVGQVRVASPFPVVEEANGPVLGDPAAPVAVPARHVGHPPHHLLVAGIDLVVVGVVYVGPATHGVMAGAQELTQGFHDV